MEKIQAAPQILVGFSGGLDSTVLLHWLHTFIAKDRLTAIHVNHGLSAHATEWQTHALQFCMALGVTCHCESVGVIPNGGDLENRARQARYAVFEQRLVSGGILLLGHHQDDQSETVLYRLLRSAGPKGLSGIPVTRSLGCGHVHRPLLSVSKLELKQYAAQESLTFVEDDSNSSDIHDRNFLRHRIMPILAQRWPDYLQRLTGAAAINLDTQELCRALAHEDLQSLEVRKERGGLSLSLARFEALTAVRQRNVLRYWRPSHEYNGPNAKIIAEVLLSVIDAKIDANPKLIYQGTEYRRFSNRLYMLDAHRFSHAQPQAMDEFDWCYDDVVDLGGHMQLTAASSLGSGLRVPPTRMFTVRMRRGGETCHPVGRTHSNSLKKCLQEFGLEPWWRDKIPLIFVGPELVAVGDLWVCEGWQAKIDELGVNIHWQDKS
ncbi:MAG: tRNA lysidine(34) synthetase TilS [Porticoccaceae bacterium]|nr:tRNA lysidine(34) synthetase TilS [Porticoccaceae bacterium]